VSQGATHRVTVVCMRSPGSVRHERYGDVEILDEGGKLAIRFTKTPSLIGDLEHWQYDTFAARWRVPNLADAYVTFALAPDGSVESFRMAAVSPAADFSFDYQDLLFRPVRPAR